MLSCRVPFIIDLSRSTFMSLNELLVNVCDAVDGRVDWPPTQDKECIAVSVLNLLNLQVSLCSQPTQSTNKSLLNLFNLQASNLFCQ